MKMENEGVPGSGGVGVQRGGGAGGDGGTACTGLYAVRRHPPGSDALQVPRLAR